MPAAPFYPGRRLSYAADLCTVRYVGPVQGTKGDWLGVEWDDPDRGKHDGSHGGVRYFECARKYPTAGSFVRPTRPSDPPNSFVEALHKKYASEPVEEDVVIPGLSVQIIGKAPDHVPVDSRGKAIMFNGKVAEEVGFDKIRKRLADLKELRIVILDGMSMARPLPTLQSADSELASEHLTDVKETSPKIYELDLSRNLLEEWREVASICIQLESLKNLRVDGTRLRSIQLDANLSSAFSKVTTLGLENTLLSWEELVAITSSFPNLTSLNASNNAFSKLPEALLPNTITELILEKNKFQSLSDLAPLTKLPNLKVLRLKNNNISMVNDPEISNEPPVFSSSLFEVDLSYNAVSDWAFIDVIPSIFPGLTAVRFSENPLYKDLRTVDGRSLTADDGYMLTIARLGNLKSLNYSTIVEKERLNAETWYLSQIAAELSSNPESKEKDIIASHRRYGELCAEYGDPVVKRAEGGAALMQPNSLAARLIRFTFYAGESVKARLSVEAETEFSVELPRSFTIYSALGVVGKRFGLPPLELRLLWETGDWIPVEEILERGTEEIGEWDSEEEENSGSRQEAKRIREVEWVAGTKMVGTWVEGMEARVRVEAM